MNKADIIAYYDALAADWDTRHTPDEVFIQGILDAAHIRKDKRILDVGTATGQFIPYILDRDCTDVTCLDFSPEMIVCAQRKFSGDPRVTTLCADIMETHFSKKFDSILVCDTLPFFQDLEAFIKHISHQLLPFGSVCIAQSMSRKEWNKKAQKEFDDSCILPSEIDLASIMGQYFKIESAISNQDLYCIAGIKK